MNAKKIKVRRSWIFLGICVLLAIGLVAGILNSRYVWLNGQMIPSSSVTLDLNGAGLTDLSNTYKMKYLKSADLRGNEISIEEYEKFLQKHPDCAVVWDVPIQGQRFSSTSAELDLTQLVCDGNGTAILEALSYFPNLSYVDMTYCGLSSEEAYAVVSAYPDIQFRWSFEICGEQHVSDETSINLSGKSPEEEDIFIQRMLYFEHLESANLNDCALSIEAMRYLREHMPDTEFTWNCRLFGVGLSTGDTSLNLAYHPIAESELDILRSAFVVFPELYSVDMCDCGLSDEVMAAFRAEYPEKDIFWRVYFGQWSSRTNATAFSTNINGQSPRCTSEDFEPLKYCTNLRSLDLGHMAIDDLSFMEHMTELRILILADNKLTDISVLANFTKLEYLELFINYITDVTPLANLENLLDLNLFGCNIADPTPLYGLQKLQRLWICRNDMTREQRQELMRKLPKCDVNVTANTATGDGWREHSRYFDVLDIINTNIWHDWT